MEKNQAYFKVLYKNTYDLVQNQVKYWRVTAKKKPSHDLKTGVAKSNAAVTVTSLICTWALLLVVQHAEGKIE